MIPPTNSPHPMPSKNNEKNAIETLFKKFINRTEEFTKASTTPQAVNLQMDHCTQETPKISEQTNSLAPRPAKAHTSPKLEHNMQILGKPTNHSSLPEHLIRTAATNLPTQPQTPSAHTLSKPQTHCQQSHSLPTLSNPKSPCTPTNQEQKLTKPSTLDKWTPTDTPTIHPANAPSNQATRHPFPPRPLYPQNQVNTATPHSDKVTPTLPILQIESVLFPPRLLANYTFESTQTLMKLLKQQLQFTQTLIKQMSRMFLPINICTSPRLPLQTLFDLIDAHPPNDPFTLLPPPYKITANHLLPVPPTDHRHQFPSKLPRYIEKSTGITHYHLSKTLLWLILSFTFPHSKDLQKVP